MRRPGEHWGRFALRSTWGTCLWRCSSLSPALSEAPLSSWGRGLCVEGRAGRRAFLWLRRRQGVERQGLGWGRVSWASEKEDPPAPPPRTPTALLHWLTGH